MKTPSKRSGPSNPRPSATTPDRDLMLPKPGEVINYSYLWEYEYRAGRDEGIKDRPVAVVIVTRSADGFDDVLVVPMTTTPPARDQHAIEVPDAVRRQLGLTAERSWIIVSEWNRFTWPGYDIRPVKKGGPGVSYGFLPAGLFRRIRDAIVAGAIGRPIDRNA
ncbi:hypothetical protein PX554_19895 [Sphingomonas sp. H39-1-10]|uniref:hypothetical protein n=1 Tax=Sphingomonas pollutisoli TaxID=3030829 RepID=UPI0023B89CE6|nr:hypothetical protein [Sphingomonas pollutisoli]MDF0490395.1 hypothetical protein [Sphingomonas pollutisoli]